MMDNPNLKRMFPWGDTLPDGNLANFCDANCKENWSYNTNDGYKRTAPVSNYPDGASPYGVLNMAGNVWEWVADWYGEDYYRQSPTHNPPGLGYGGGRVLRGGAWFNPRLDMRCAGRHGDDPELTFDDVGFRCAISSQ
jgi:formylglycine-generating enzyme required for sulfatase activity